MAKQNYPKLQTRMSGEMKQIFDKFLSEKAMQQAEFFEKYLPSLLMAIDKPLYLRLYQEAYESVELQNEIEKVKK